MDEIAAIAATTNPEEGDYTAVDALLQPNDCVIRQVPAVEIDAINAIRFTSGNPANLPEEPLNPDQPMRVFRASDGVFLGIGIWRDGALAPKRVVNLAD